MEALIKKIQANLTPDLLKKQYRTANATNPMYGHCYVATETLYHLLDDRTDWHVIRGRDDAGIVHWWLKNGLSNEIADVTADQYHSVGRVPPYANGKRGFFLTNEPSKRCRMVLDRVRGKLV